MITGTVHASREASLYLSVRGPEGAEQEIEAEHHIERLTSRNVGPWPKHSLHCKRSLCHVRL